MGSSLVYIMGRGHSGSTALDAILGNAPGISNTGELASGFATWPDSECSCGAKMADCPRWRGALDRLARASLSPEQVRGYLVAQANVRRFPRTLAGPATAEWAAVLRHSVEAVTNAVLESAEASVMIDSSKEHTLALFLARFVPSAKLIHLVRDPIAVTASYHGHFEAGRRFMFMRRSLGPESTRWLAMLAIALSWSAGQVLAEVVRLIAPDRVLRVRFEDLVSNPGIELDRIGKFIGCDLGPVIERIEAGESIAVGHTVGGNRMRHRKTFVFSQSQGAPRPLPPIWKLVTRLVNLPMMLRHGYKPWS